VTEQQKRAIEYPCRLAIETVHPRFGWLRGDGISVILTINFGYE